MGAGAGGFAEAGMKMNPYQSTPFSAIHLPKGDAMEPNRKSWHPFWAAFISTSIGFIGGAAFEYFLLRK